MPNLTDRVAALVVSCDKYSDLWEPYFSLFWRFWPDCPFSVYLLNNNIDLTIPQVQILSVGEDISWSDNLRKAITPLKEEYILLLIEDFFICDFIDTAKLLEVLARALDKKVNCIRMTALPKPDKRIDEAIGIASKGTVYRTSVVSSVWKKGVLLDLLKPGENAWDFEINGSVRSDAYDAFYSTCQNHFPTINGVIKGKWQRSAIRKLKSFGIEPDLTNRTVMSRKEATLFSLKEFRTKTLHLFPAKHRRKVKDFFWNPK